MTMPVGAPSAPPGVGAAAPASAATPGGGVGCGVAGATPGVEGFGALVAAALAATGGAPSLAEAVTPVAAGATARAQDPTKESDPSADTDEESVGGVADDEKAAQLLGVVVPVALLAVVPVAAAPLTADVAGSSLGAGADTALGAVSVAPDAAMPVTAQADGSSSGDAGKDAQSSAPVPQLPGADEPGASPAAPSHVGPHATAEAASSPEVTTDPVTPSVPQVVAPIDGAKAVTGAAGASASTATGPVAQQTFPEVTRLMSRGDGTHRVTLELRPEGLGEVRVVLTLRDGKVDVRMTTSTEARHALASDLPELHRLLAASGATETSVSVRDGQQLVSSSSWDGSRSSASSSHDLMGQTGEGTGQPRHQESPQQARTSADHIATDGVRDRARASGPNDPATGTRTTGLDVTV